VHVKNTISIFSPTEIYDRNNHALSQKPGTFLRQNEPQKEIGFSEGSKKRFFNTLNADSGTDRLRPDRTPAD
jgi:hypothetical protein